MYTLITLFKFIVVLSLINVWVFQRNKATLWRGGAAKTITEEFEVYGLPLWSCYLIGALKVILGIALFASIWLPVLIRPAAIGLAILFAGSLAMHLKVKDVWYKLLPSLVFLLMCVFIAYEGQIASI